jgi:ankyrin repeat protein
MNEKSKRKRSESEQKEVDYTNDQWLFDLIEAKDWKTALSLLTFKTPDHEKDLVKLMYQRERSLLWIIVQTNNKMCRSATDLCLRLIEIGGEELVKETGIEINPSNSDDDEYKIPDFEDLTVLHLACRKTDFVDYDATQDDEGNWVELITKLIEIGGVEYLNMADSWGETALSYASSYRGKDNPAVVRRLLELGGENILFSLKSENNLSVLQNALFNRTKHPGRMEIIQLLLDFGGEKLVYMADTRGMTALHHVISLGEENIAEIIRRLIKIGGEKLIMMTTVHDHNFLFHAQQARGGVEMEQIIDILFEFGGKKMLCKQSVGGTALLYMFYKGKEPERWPAIVDKLLEAGGKKLLLEKRDSRGNSPFHFLCMRADLFTPPLTKMLKKLIDIGGKKMVMWQDRWGKTALYFACSFSIGERSLGVIKELIEAGGKEFVLKPTYGGLTPLHQACECTDHSPFREQAIDLLLDVGREKLLFTIDYQSELTAIGFEGKKSEPSQRVLDRFIEIGGERARNLLTTARQVVEEA